jgi:polyferredoxin
MRRSIAYSLIAIFMLAAPALGVERTERFPAPDFHKGYTLPVTQTAPAQSVAWQWVDVGALFVALAVMTWAVLYKRSRGWVLGISVFSLLYFGFWRKGCICPVGSVQNVAFAAGGHGYALPLPVAAFFLMPLLFALFRGRIFCSGVCPLGAIQDLVLYKPIHVPPWVEVGLGLFAWVYLGLAVLFAAIGSDFVICRYDPFVGFFRLSGPAHMILIGGILLALSMFVGRAYCRFLCPYSVLLRLLSPFAKKQVSITPTRCTGCRLCERSCPFGAIRYPSSRHHTIRFAGRRRGVLLTAAIVPASILVMAGAGYLASSAMARLDFTVRLASHVREEQARQLRATTDETKAFSGTGQMPEQLYATTAQIEHRFAIGTPIFGAWMGLAVGGKLLGLALRRRRNDYTADPSACLACARCFASCPAEVVTGAAELEAEAVAV